MPKMMSTEKRNTFHILFNRRFLFTCLLAIILLGGTKPFAQRDATPTAVWILPGVIYQAPKQLKFSCQYGINSNQSINAIYVQAFINTGKHVTLNPAYLYLRSSPLGSRHLHEHGFMSAVILSLPLKHVLIDDRNLIWSRFRRGTASYHFYRNRLRIIKPFTWKSRECKVYAYDEGWFFINKGQWTRNRLAAGFSCDVVSWFIVDVSFVRQHDKTSRIMNLFFIMGTIQLMHKRNQ